MGNFIFSTDYNYQKMALNQTDTIVIPASSSASMSFSHNLGYIPSARVWYEPNGDGMWFPLSNVQLPESFNDILGVNGIYYLTTTDVVVTLFDVTATINNCNVIVRVYYDD